jgi:16S rRNA C967 or C1407 C5-methylase (RsmB/RsmF family)
MLAVDLCAGAGGKTLALAADMAGQGRLVACDTDRGRLSRIPARLERAGITIVETRLLDPGKEVAALRPGRTRAILSSSTPPARDRDLARPIRDAVAGHARTARRGW